MCVTSCQGKNHSRLLPADSPTLRLAPGPSFRRLLPSHAFRGRYLPRAGAGSRSPTSWERSEDHIQYSAIGLLMNGVHRLTQCQENWQEIELFSTLVLVPTEKLLTNPSILRSNLRVTTRYGVLIPKFQPLEGSEGSYILDHHDLRLHGGEGNLPWRCKVEKAKQLHMVFKRTHRDCTA